MKCIQYTDKLDMTVARIADDDAHAAVKAGAARYIPRHVWKDKVRDLGKNVAAMIAARDARRAA